MIVEERDLLLCLRFLGKKEHAFIPRFGLHDVLTMTMLSRRVELELCTSHACC